MQQHDRFVQVFTAEELGTITTLRAIALSGQDTKRKRKSQFRNLQYALPAPSTINSDAKFELESISIGADKNGNAVIIAVYARKVLP